MALSIRNCNVTELIYVGTSSSVPIVKFLINPINFLLQKLIQTNVAQ